MNMREVHAPSDEQQRELRDRLGAWLVPRNMNNNDWKFHIPGEDGCAVCEGVREMSLSSLELKDVSAYPRGWRGVCAYCWTAYEEDESAE